MILGAGVQDVIVTGLPRAGATAVAALVDYLPESVCLNSPKSHLTFARKHPALAFGKWLVGDFAWQRRQLLRQVPLADKRAADGTPFFDGAGEDAPVFFTRPDLTPDFTLAMKHHSLYTAVLPTLAEFGHFKVIAVIRNPLDTLASWQKHGIPAVAPGNPPGIARFWPEALAVAQSAGDPLDIAVQLYELFIQRYHELADRIHIVKYEDVMANPMLVSELLGKKTLSAATPMLAPAPRGLNAAAKQELRERIKKYGVFTKLYYDEA